jgi:hypothetical protein
MEYVAAGIGWEDISTKMERSMDSVRSKYRTICTDPKPQQAAAIPEISQILEALNAMAFSISKLNKDMDELVGDSKIFQRQVIRQVLSKDRDSIAGMLSQVLEVK